jgi:hypothetical protein
VKISRDLICLFFKEIYEEEEENLIATHADYRLFAVINHHGGSSDVGMNNKIF